MSKTQTPAAIAKKLAATKSSWTSSTTLKSAWDYAKKHALTRDMPMRIAAEMNKLAGIKPPKRGQGKGKSKSKSQSRKRSRSASKKRQTKSKPRKASTPKRARSKSRSRSRSRSHSASRTKNVVNVYLSGGATRKRFPMSKAVMAKHLAGMGVKVVSGHAHWIVLAPGVKTASQSAIDKAGESAKTITWAKFMEQYPIPE